MFFIVLVSASVIISNEYYAIRAMYNKKRVDTLAQCDKDVYRIGNVRCSFVAQDLSVHDADSYFGASDRAIICVI